jgi:hypothetical protein
MIKLTTSRRFGDRDESNFRVQFFSFSFKFFFMITIVISILLRGLDLAINRPALRQTNQTGRIRCFFPVPGEGTSVCAKNREEGVNPVLNPHDLSLLNGHLKNSFCVMIQFNKVNAHRYIPAYRERLFWISGQDGKWTATQPCSLSESGCKRHQILSPKPLARNGSCD